MTGVIRVISLLAITSLFSGAAFAQQPASVAKVTPAGQQSEPVNDTEDDQNKSVQKQSDSTSNDRLFFVLPNFLTLETAQGSPLSPHEKFKVLFGARSIMSSIPGTLCWQVSARLRTANPATGRDPPGMLNATELPSLTARSKAS